MIVAITAIYYNKAKQGSTHKYTKKGTDQRIIQNVIGWVDLEIQRKAHKCILIFKYLLLVPPYLSDNY